MQYEENDEKIDEYGEVAEQPDVAGFAVVSMQRITSACSDFGFRLYACLVAYEYPASPKDLATRLGRDESFVHESLKDLEKQGMCENKFNQEGVIAESEASFP